MGDTNYWKDRYKHSWSNAVTRVKKVMTYLADMGIEVKAFSDDALSDHFIEGKTHDSGMPDLKIRVGETEVILGEVTGPDIPIPVTSALWFRPDKMEWADAHPEEEVWGLHILESESDLIRCVKFETGLKDKCRVITVPIRGTKERYVEIPASDKRVTSFEDFCDMIDKRRGG